MLKLERIRTEGIPEAFRGQARIDKMLQQLKDERDIRRGDVEAHEFPSIWSPAKLQLHAESNNKCAYCEAPTTLVAYGDVEHYRPKSIYWWLAYCYENYLASCTLCNQKYKKAKFESQNAMMDGPSIRSNNRDTTLENKAAKVTPDPFTESDGRSWAEYESAHHSERPYLLNPYIDDPEDYIAWEVNHVDEGVNMVALDPTDAFQIKMMEIMERDLGINRNELRTHRYDTYLTYATARLTVEDQNSAQQLRALQANRRKRMLEPDKEFSGMLLYFDRMASADLPLPG